MRIKCLLLLATTFACGCDQSSKTIQTPNGPATSPAVAPATDSTDTNAGHSDPTATPTIGETTPADNSSVNKRDNDSAAKTPIDQNENAADIKITADIRKRVLEQPDFSVNARNVKIITADGKVTLRGPVKSEDERNTINKIAHEIAGEKNVDSHLEVAP